MKEKEKETFRACHQLKDVVAKMAGFENRIAEYIKAYLRKGSAENRHLQSKSRSLITRPNKRTPSMVFKEGEGYFLLGDF